MGGLILFLIEGGSQLFMAISMRKQHEQMQEMMKQMKQREMQMASHGGENPYEVSYNKEQADKINEAESKDAMTDSSGSLESQSGGVFGGKSFSF